MYINRSVPEDSLEDFDIDLYCVPPGAGGEINYETQDPVKTTNAKIAQGNSREGIVNITHYREEVAHDEMQLFICI